MNTLKTFLGSSSNMWDVLISLFEDLPGGSDGKESACNARNLGLISGLGRSLGRGNGNRLQYSCLENSRNSGAWQPTMGSQRVGHDWAAKHTHTWLICPMHVWHMVFSSHLKRVTTYIIYTFAFHLHLLVGMTCLHMQQLSLIQRFLFENTQRIPRCHHDNVDRATM